MKPRTFPTAWLIAALLLSPTMAGIPIARLIAPTVQAASRAQEERRTHWKSDDLEVAVNNVSDELVSVIIDTKSDDDRAFRNLSARVSQSGGSVSRGLNNTRQLAARVPAAFVDTLAADESVNYVLMDRPIQAAGHLETTTGSAQVRKSVAHSTIDGSGIGIAILDS